MHAGQPFIGLPDAFHIREIESGIHAVGIHIKSQRYDIHVSGPFAVAEQSAFDPVRPCQNAKFRSRDAAAPVIMRVQAENHVIAVIQVLIHIFQLAGKHMRHRILHRRRNVDDRLVICRGLPYIQHRIADIHRIVDFRTRKTLRAVLEGEVPIRLGCKFQQQFCAVHRDLLNLFFALFKYLLSLSYGCGVI